MQSLSLTKGNFSIKMADLVIVKGSRYSCNECEKSFTSERKLITHIGFIQVVNHLNVLLVRRHSFRLAI